MKLFLTEYEKDGIQHEGPIIVAPSFELALEQAQYLDIKLVGELEVLIPMEILKKLKGHYTNGYRKKHNTTQSRRVKSG